MTLATHRTYLLATIIALVTGCAVGPDFKRPAAPEVSGYTPEPLPKETEKTDGAGSEAQRFVREMDIPGQWWTVFHSEPLDGLIGEALKNNADLQAAQAALRVAQENYNAQRAVYYPSVEGNFAPSRQKNSNTLSPTLAVPNVPIFSLYNTQVTVSYALDVFGGNRRQVETLKAQAESQRFQLEATYLTLTSNVVAAAVQEASLRGQIAAMEEVIRIESEQLEILRKQHALGQIAGADVAAQEAVFAQTQAQLPPLLKQLEQQRDLLIALVGRFPSEDLVAKFELSDLTLPRDLPLSLPSKLVEQRPDIRSAEAQLHAASAQVGVAIANMLPQITLSANIGSVATDIGQLIQPGNGFWQLAGGLTQPIFEGGSLYHKTLAARAAFDQTAAQYRGTVITAFQNVADTLRALQHDADALKAQSAAERSALESLTIARKQLQLGSIGYLGLLNAEQAYQQATINRVQAQAGRYADTVALFQALGGGWWNRPENKAQ